MSVEGTLRNLTVRKVKELVEDFFLRFQVVVDKILFKTLGIVYHEYWKREMLRKYNIR